jgi:hypothetical protein
MPDRFAHGIGSNRGVVADAVQGRALDEADVALDGAGRPSDVADGLASKDFSRGKAVESSWATVETLTTWPVGGGSARQWLAAKNAVALSDDSWIEYEAPVVLSHVTISANIRTSPQRLDFLCILISVGLLSTTTLIAVR